MTNGLRASRNPCEASGPGARTRSRLRRPGARARDSRGSRWLPRTIAAPTPLQSLCHPSGWFAPTTLAHGYGSCVRLFAMSAEDDGRALSTRWRPVRRRLGLLAVMVLASVAVAAPTRSSYPDCIDSWAESRYRNYGYDHIVHIHNRCERAATCEVSTNVNPVSQHVTVLPKHDVEVLTFRGSPSRDFAPRVECELFP